MMLDKYILSNDVQCADVLIIYSANFSNNLHNLVFKFPFRTYLNSKINKINSEIINTSFKYLTCFNLFKY